MEWCINIKLTDLYIHSLSAIAFLADLEPKGESFRKERSGIQLKQYKQIACQCLRVVVCQMHLTDYLITLVSVRVCVCPPIGCRTITSTILYRFHQILHAAQKCGCFECYCFWDKPEVVYRF